MGPQRARKRRVVNRRCGRLRYDDDIKALKHRLMHAERFSDLTFDAVARDSLARYPARHGDTETGLAFTRRGLYHEEPIALAVASAFDRGEFGRAAEPLAARQTKASARKIYTLSRARPLARRALITARPPAVRIRALKPCVRLRLSTLGW